MTSSFILFITVMSNTVLVLTIFFLCTYSNVSALSILNALEKHYYYHYHYQIVHNKTSKYANGNGGYWNWAKGKRRFHNASFLACTGESEAFEKDDDKSVISVMSLPLAFSGVL